MGNNPVMGVDPDGQLVWFAPIIIGAAIGAISGGLRAKSAGLSTFGGIWRGALVGGIGGALSIFGTPAALGANIFQGAFSGALTGGLDAALFNGDIGKSMLTGAISGAAMGLFSSQHFKNGVKGQGFKNNDGVLKTFVDKGEYQGALDYFKIKGEYAPIKPSGGEYIESLDYLGATNPRTGKISFGNASFSSYDNLNATYSKELFTSNRVIKGMKLATQEPIGTMKKYFPEERLGFINSYKNKGLFPKTTINFRSQISYYEFGSYNLEQTQYFSPNQIQKFIYQLPRRWNFSIN
jgi:hypothetical protein